MLSQVLAADKHTWNIHYGNTLIQIYRKFHLQKLKNFQMKNSDIFHISAPNKNKTTLSHMHKHILNFSRVTNQTVEININKCYMLY